MTAHLLHWLAVAASGLLALCELAQGDARGVLNLIGMLFGAGAIAHIKLFAEKAAPFAKAAADALADTQEMPRLAPGTHPDDAPPAT